MIGDYLFQDNGATPVEPLLPPASAQTELDPVVALLSSGTSIVVPEPATTPASFAASAVPPSDYFAFAPQATDSPLLPAEVHVELDESLFPPPTAVASPEMVVPCEASGRCSVCLTDPCGCSPHELLEADVAVGQKRQLEETSMYTSPGPLPDNVPRFFAKNEAAEKDAHQTELCERLAKTSCKDKNPEVAQHAKFIKKASA